MSKATNDAKVISSKGTFRQINWLLREGFTKREIAKRLGYKNQVLQFKERITARTALKVAKFYNQIRAGE